jgi:hypothetical protein
MSRRLRRVAHDLLAGFVGRNNDADGYWALGRLYRKAPAVRFELVDGTAEPPSAVAQRIVPQLRALIVRILAPYGVDPSRVRRAVIRIEFAAGAADDARRQTYGDRFTDLQAARRRAGSKRVRAHLRLAIARINEVFHSLST